MEGYIYKLTSPSGKCYIGQTVNIKRRLSEYKTFHHCKNQKKLFNAIKKYGFENFTHEIIETINEDILDIFKTKLNELEIHYISFYDCIKNGYNICLGGNQHRLGVKESEEQIQRKRDRWTVEMKLKQSEKWKGDSNPRKGVSEKTYSKPINQYTKEGKYLKTWESALSAEKELYYNATNIGKVCLGKCLTAYGFIWRFNDKESNYEDIIPIESNRGKNSTKGINSVAILQYSKNNEFIAEFSSIIEIENKFGISHSNISAVAKGKRKTAGGFIWKYKK